MINNDDDDVMKVKDIDIDDETAGVCECFFIYLLIKVLNKNNERLGSF